MFGSVWNFIKRHKRKFVFTGVCVGGIFLLGKYAKRKLQTFQDNEAEECLAHARRQHHFDSNQRTCNMTVLSMLPTLRERVIHLFDSEALTSQLKNKPVNKLEIWDDLKIMSFSRMVLSVYSSCFLIVFLRVQLNIVGGYMYLDSLLNTERGDSPELCRATTDIQQQYLGLINYLLEKGLEGLSSVIHQQATHHLKDISLKEQISLSDIQQVIDAIRKQIEPCRDNGFVKGSRTNLVQYILPQEEQPAQACAMSHAEITLKELRTETNDLLDSSDFTVVLNACLDTGFSRIIDKLAEYFKPSEMEGSSIVNPNELCMPLAKVIPIANGLVYTVLSDAPNTFVQELLLKDQVKDFAANVYEAFSQPVTEQSP